ncbi:leucine-rich repeat protein, partial [uncultured Treponema sp.]|uniref:leucine-rich repeat protein n=1 Tax=uncultured Treponema sp. TaxID=162155 RepID=UPI0028E7D645
VTFDAKGGTPVPAAQTVKYKEKATEPPALTKEGHTFEGWYNKAGNAPWDFAVNEVTGNTELYAKWRINTYPVTFSVKGTPPNGTLKAEVAGSVIVSGDPVEYGKIVTFTAVPESGYKVDTWTVTPAAALQEGGTTESPTAKVKIAADTEVNVSFIQAIYAIVPFGENGINLRNHLRTATPHTDGIYYIKVTGLKAEDLYGCVDSFRAHASTLGEVLKNNPTKKVALKLGEIHGLTDMSWCFFMCEELIQVHEIPKGVKYMKGCFSGCTNLTQVSDIPSSVTNMAHCFSGCKITQAPVISNGVTDMSYCFSGCRSLTHAPVIPESVTDMNSCFFDCTSLSQAPVIPNGVTDMSHCFYQCRSLTQAPVISEGVIDMVYCFGGCTNLSQAPVIPKTVRYMISCFESCEKITTVTLKCPYNPIQISNPNLWSGQKYAFENAFKNCKGLGYGSIKVPADQLKRYRFYASTIMGAESSWFIAE